MSGYAGPVSTPLDVAPDTDVPLLMRLLKRVEADHHRHGWDQLPRLMVVYDETDHLTARTYRRMMGENPRHGTVPSVRVAPYVAQTVVPPSVWIGMSPDGTPLTDERRKPFEHLRTWALNIAYGDPSVPLTDDQGDLPTIGEEQVAALEYLRGVLRLPGLRGYLFVGESWRRRVADLAAELAAGPVDYGTLPDSVEARAVYCVDLHDRVHVVRRMRGDRPVSVDTAQGPRTMITPGAEQVEAVPDSDLRGDITTSLRILADMSMGRTPPAEAFHTWYPTLADIVAGGGAVSPGMSQVRDDGQPPAP